MNFKSGVFSTKTLLSTYNNIGINLFEEGGMMSLGHMNKFIVEAL